MDNIGSVERMDYFKVFEMQHFVFDSTRHQTTQRVGNENRKIVERSFSQFLDEQLKKQNTRKKKEIKRE